MIGIHAMNSRSQPDALAVRPPRQQRTREQWGRVLDAGVSILEEGGYEAFTIAAVCDRAAVPPRALYARVATKDALFLAAYERGMERVLDSHQIFREPSGWRLEPAELVRRAVRELMRIFTDHARFLRAVVLISSAHSEIQQRGEQYRNVIGDLFAAVLEPLDRTSTHADPVRAREFCFSVVFSALVVRSAYGPAFGMAGDEPKLAQELADMVATYLLSS
jgi:AcrR family transcriptional regulator